jgi:hypothetical protein
VGFRADVLVIGVQPERRELEHGKRLEHGLCMPPRAAEQHASGLGCAWAASRAPSRRCGVCWICCARLGQASADCSACAAVALSASGVSAWGVGSMRRRAARCTPEPAPSDVGGAHGAVCSRLHVAAAHVYFFALFRRPGRGCEPCSCATGRRCSCATLLTRLRRMQPRVALRRPPRPCFAARHIVGALAGGCTARAALRRLLGRHGLGSRAAVATLGVWTSATLVRASVSGLVGVYARRCSTLRRRSTRTLAAGTPRASRRCMRYAPNCRRATVARRQFARPAWPRLAGRCRRVGVELPLSRPYGEL